MAPENLETTANLSSAQVAKLLDAGLNYKFPADEINPRLRDNENGVLLIRDFCGRIIPEFVEEPLEEITRDQGIKRAYERLSLDRFYDKYGKGPEEYSLDELDNRVLIGRRKNQ